MPLHVGPFTREDAVEHAVACRPVAASQVMTDDAILLGAQGLDRTLRGEVEIIGAQTDHLATKRFESVAKQQQLATGIDMAALPALSVPCVTDFDTADRGHDIVIARAADNRVARQLP